MEFWLSVIRGMQFRPGATVSSIDHSRNQAYGLFEKHGVDLERMVSKASPEVRAADYFNMSAAFAELVTPGTVEANPIEKVVRMIDRDKSLGAQVERVFAREIGSKVMNICVMEQASPSALNKVNQRLAQDSARLISFGATVFDTHSKTVSLVLVEDEAA